MAAGGNGRFGGGNPPGGDKGNFNTTINGDHILGTDGDDTGADSPNNIQADAIVGFDFAAAGLAATDLLIDLQDGNDLFNGFGGDDWVYGGAGDDNLNGGDGDDVLVGGDDNDTIEGGEGADYIDGSAGNDTASYEDSTDVEADGSGVTVNLSTGDASGDDAEGDTLVSIENLVGSAFDDTLTGDDGDNVIEGGDGDDTINGLGGDDTIVGGDGDDDLTGGLGTDTFLYNAADEGLDTITDFDTDAPGGVDEGDLLDISAALSGFTGTTVQDAVDADFLAFVDDGSGNIKVQVDADGGGDGFVDLAVLSGVGFTSEADSITLLDDNFIL